MYAGIYDDESLYPITIVDTDDIQARVIVVPLVELGHIGYLHARTLTIGPSDALSYRVSSKIM